MAIACVSKHRVFIHDRGGVQRLDELVNVTSVKYERTRDDTSQATIKISSAACGSQRAALDRISAGRHEVVIYRGEERAWEGPIRITTDEASGYSLDASDVTYYMAKTVLHAAYSNAYPNIAYVIDRAKTMMNAELARKEALDPPINVLPHVLYVQTPDDAKTSRVTKPYEKTLFGDIDDMAAKSGMDYTTVGRRIIFWDTDNNIGQTPALTDNDFLGEGLIVSSYGSELITHSISTDGQGNFGSAGGIDDYYGEWEALQSPSEESADGPPPTQAELDSQALANLAGHNPAPVLIRVSDNSTINPNGTLQLGDLVPGVFIPVRATINGKLVMQWQKLDSVTVSEDDKGEKIQVSMSPAPIGAIIA